MFVNINQWIDQPNKCTINKQLTSDIKNNKDPINRHYKQVKQLQISEIQSQIQTSTHNYNQQQQLNQITQTIKQITIANIQMDIRQRNKPLTQQGSQQQQNALNQQQLNDALIYNIMKKIELRQRLVEQYKKQKQQTNKGILSKYYIHGDVPGYYAALVVFGKIGKIIYMKPGAPINAIFSIPNALFHVCVFVSLNQYYKYRNIFYLKHEMGQQYRIYQRNVENLMQEKIEKFSIMDKLGKSDMINSEHLVQTLKYRLVL